MKEKDSQIMSSDVSMMVSDAMAASMGVLVVIISLLMLNVREEYEQKILELNMVKSEQTGITTDKPEVTNIVLVDESFTIKYTQGGITYATIEDFEKALRDLPGRFSVNFVVYAEGAAPFQKVINATDILTRNHPQASIDIGAIDK